MFAGCGGMDLGFKGGFTYRGEKFPSLGFRIERAYDNDRKCVETYRDNLGQRVEELDLSDYDASSVPAADVLIGGFPCQDFSSCGPQAGLRSERGRLYLAMVKYMEKHNPLVVVAENVIGLERIQSGAILKKILADLSAAGDGYQFDVWSLDATEYGVPQNRRRLFIVGRRKDMSGFPLPPEPRYRGCPRTVDWAIHDLVDVKDDSVPNQDQFFKASKAKKGNGQGDEANRVGEPSYTIRANARSRVQFHYSLSRRLTVRECARLQTFPDSFTFSHSATSNIMQIGNAVPPVLAHRIATSIHEYLASCMGGSDPTAKSILNSIGV